MPCCLLLAAPAAADVRTQVLGTWGGEVRTVYIDEAVDPYTAYVGSGRNLVVLDVTDPANVVELGRIDLGDLVLDVKVHDGYAFVGTYGEPSNFCTVNVADPANMYVAWTSDYYGPGWEVELHGDLAWVFTHSDLRRFNISDPENLYWGGVAIWSIPETFTIVGDLMYVGVNDASGWPKLYVYDLAPDPVYPTLLGFGEMTSAPGDGFDPTAITVEGDYAYMTLQEGWLAVWDVSNPAAPAHVGDYGDFEGGTIGGLDTSNGVVYVVDGTLQTLDITTDPTAPTLLGTFETHGWVVYVEVVGSRAYAMSPGEGLIILDVSTPASPVHLGDWLSPAHLRQMAKVGNLLYLTDVYNGMTILDVADPLQPVLVGAYQTSGGANCGIAVRDDIAYISAGWGGIELVAVSDPASPMQIGAYPFEPGLSATALELDGDVAHVGVNAGVGGYLVNFDISDPADIVDVGFISLGAPPNAIATRPDGIAHVTGGTVLGGGGGAVYAIDTSVPASPFLVSEVDLAPLDAPKDVAIQGDLRFVTNWKTDGTGGLYIQDVSDPSQPQTVGFLENYAASCVAVRGDVAYLVCTWAAAGHAAGVADAVPRPAQGRAESRVAPEARADTGQAPGLLRPAGPAADDHHRAGRRVAPVAAGAAAVRSGHQDAQRQRQDDHAGSGPAEANRGESLPAPEVRADPEQVHPLHHGGGNHRDHRRLPRFGMAAAFWAGAVCGPTHSVRIAPAYVG